MPNQDVVTNPNHRNNLTRRAVVRKATYGAALVALPPTAAFVSFDLARGSSAMPETTDLHLAWQAEVDRLDQAIDDAYGTKAEDELVERRGKILDLIAGTMPTTPEGAAIVARALLAYQDPPDGFPLDYDAECGRTLAQYLLRLREPA